MAKIDARLEPLLLQLQRQGFAWLVAEIIQVIETGRPFPGDVEKDVDGVRAQIRSGGSKHKSAPRSFEDVNAELTDAPFSQSQPFSPDEQVSQAVDLMIRRLACAAEWLEASTVMLSNMMGAEVTLYTLDNESSPRRVDFDATQEATKELRSIREALVNSMQRVSQI